MAYGMPNYLFLRPPYNGEEAWGTISQVTKVKAYPGRLNDLLRGQTGSKFELTQNPNSYSWAVHTLLSMG